MGFKDTGLKYTIGGRAMAGMSIFVSSCLEPILIWLIVMFMVIVCDFIAGCRKSLSMGVKFRFSRAVRATMGKMCTYFSFVVTMVFMEKATSFEGLSKWAISIVCFFEITSVINNLLIPKGYCLDFKVVIGWITERFLGIKNSGVIKDTKKDEDK